MFTSGQGSFGNDKMASLPGKLLAMVFIFFVCMSIGRMWLGYWGLLVGFAVGWIIYGFWRRRQSEADQVMIVQKGIERYMRGKR
jgi:hypothetical protein